MHALQITILLLLLLLLINYYYYRTAIWPKTVVKSRYLPDSEKAAANGGPFNVNLSVRLGYVERVACILAEGSRSVTVRVRVDFRVPCAVVMSSNC